VARAIRLAITITALILVCAFLFVMGRELAKWAPPEASRSAAMVQMTVLPAVLGTALVILAFLPLPGQFILGWISTSFFWLFTAAGAFFGSKDRSASEDLRIRPFDYVGAAAVLAAVRILATGILLN